MSVTGLVNGYANLFTTFSNQRLEATQNGTN
jgi:hypothetical protein